MMKRIILLCGIVLCIGNNAFADDASIENDDFIPIDELLVRTPDDTQCATAVFERGLQQTLRDVDSATDQATIETLIHQAFSTPDVLSDVLACPEIANIDDADTITFLPVKYTFPDGREIVVNYETQPKILRQRLTLSEKRTLPSADPNPQIGTDGAEWSNTDPAWYGIMVVQHGTLDNFVGPDKNNTVSLQYIEDNVDALFPQNRACTRKSATATRNNPSMVNQAMHMATKDTGQKDTNAYYVAGDVNLQWISYLEIGLDVVLTVVTMGGWTAVAGVTKAARASRVLKNLGSTIRTLSKSENVTKYMRAQTRATKIARDINIAKSTNVAKSTDKLNDLRKTIRTAQNTPNIKKYTDMQKNADALRKQIKTADAATKPQMTKQLDELNKSIKQMAESKDIKQFIKNQKDAEILAKNIRTAENADVKGLNKELDEINKTMREMERADPDVEKYKNATKSFAEINKWRRAVRAMRIPQRGNIVVRAWRAARAANTGAKTINRGARIARAGMKSGRVRDWLFHSTMRNAAKLAKLEAKVGLVYGIIKFGGDMYDWTETSTGDFTNDIQFKPLLLLSADDLDGQENVVNHGMWLMWMGDSTNAADDDAAFLQVMDATDKFHQDLTELQDEKNEYPCNVDIYVVRPIIRNPGDADAQLYYLIMNDEPWTTMAR